ncbi:MAG: hypothetical protein MUE63_08255 [Xanthomonadales bacterium]|nr:hypothetical protein [Xanthomonadales bacterium]
MKRSWPLLAWAAVLVLAAVLLPAVPQPAAYHDFADQRAFFGVNHFVDVASNIAFLLAGVAGLLVVWLRRAQFERRAESVPYVVFFLGVALTAAGSAWYHLAPDNERLFWDRLPMTIAFMSLIAAQLVERVDRRLGLVLLPALLAVGMASVVYWIATERAGAGNVVPYVALQAYAVGALLVLAAGYPSRYTRGRDVYLIFGAYLLAKVLEYFDREVLAFGQVVSGHALKHVAAAIAGLLVCRMLWLRTRSLDEPA